MSAAWLFAAALAVAVPASAQSIFKCKGADGRTTYSGTPCAGEGSALPSITQGRPAPAGAGRAAAAAAPPADATAALRDENTPSKSEHRAPLPKQCDNKASLQFVITRLDSKATPDDIRDFLADERFRLLRCEFTRFTADELRERSAAIEELEARAPQRRRVAMLRIEALYDRYLTTSERAQRARNRQR
jgi:hypothetical protein